MQTLPEINKTFTVTNKDLQNVFNDVKKEFGEAIAKATEKLFRLETSNFTSDAFKHTMGAGMLSAAKNWPFGWTSLKPLWENANYSPIGTFTRYVVVDANGHGVYVSPNTPGAKKYTYLVFPSITAGIMAVA